MSTISGTSSSGKIDEVLGAILKRLDAKLSQLHPINDKVTALEAATGELGAQQDTLTAVVERVDRAHSTLATQVNRTDMVPHDQVSGRPANNGRRRRMEDDDNHGDFVPKATLEFPPATRCHGSTGVNVISISIARRSTNACRSRHSISLMMPIFGSTATMANRCGHSSFNW
jgi:hypothetical protein